MNASQNIAAITTGLLLVMIGGMGPVDAGGTGPGEWAGDLAPIAASDWNHERAAHLFERAGFGGTPDEVGKLAAMTPDEAVSHLLDFEKIDASHLPPFEESGIYPNGYKFQDIGTAAKKAYVTGKAFGVNARREGELPFQPGINEFYTMLWSDFGEIGRASQWWANRMLVTPRPFEEKMTLFWHDHFATSQEKVHRHNMMLNQIETLRKHSAGNFRAMLTAIAQDPAMLIWLDNKDNTKERPNENFAREIMELFTMSEGRGYTEQDIREVARAFTGWTMTKDETTAPEDGKFVIDPAKHDDGVKTFLGATGNFDGHGAIAVILGRPEPALYLTKKIYEYFVRQEIDSAMNENLAALLRENDYEIKPLMRAIFLSRDFYSAPSVGTQIKGPVHLVVSTYRKMGLKEIPGLPDFNTLCGSLGQYLFMPPNVAGWADGKPWMNPATLLTRGNFVEALLFPPDPATYEPPDKMVAEGYRKIPVSFPEYKDIIPNIWNNETGRMEAVPLPLYDKWLTGEMTASQVHATAEEWAASGKMDQMMAEAKKMEPQRGEQKSRMSQVATGGETYNLAIGVYMGAVQAADRVKPIPRTPAKMDFASMLKAEEVKTAAEAVDRLTRRFLSVPLSGNRRQKIVEFLQGELGDETVDYDREGLETILRRAVHLVISAPEYQLA